MLHFSCLTQKHHYNDVPASVLNHSRWKVNPVYHRVLQEAPEFVVSVSLSLCLLSADYSRVAVCSPCGERAASVRFHK